MHASPQHLACTRGALTHNLCQTLVPRAAAGERLSHSHAVRSCSRAARTRRTRWHARQIPAVVHWTDHRFRFLLVGLSQRCRPPSANSAEAKECSGMRLVQLTALAYVVAFVTDVYDDA